SSQIHSFSEIDNIAFLETHDSKDVARRALRFLYCFHRRFAQYADYIRPLSIYENKYNLDADASRILNAVECNGLAADDPSFAHDLVGEDEVVERFVSQDSEFFNKNRV